jgi:AraC family transcriptional activator of pyochelin receptor
MILVKNLVFQGNLKYYHAFCAMIFVIFYFCSMEIHFTFLDEAINTSKCRIKNTPINEGLTLVEIENREDHSVHIERDIDQSLIQFYFGAEGELLFQFHQGSYQLQLNKGRCLLFYNPLMALPLRVELKADSRALFLYIKVESLHRLFIEGSEELAFISPDNVNKKFYSEIELEPSLMVAVNQVFQSPVQGPSKKVFIHAKVLELLALFFNRKEGTDVEACPFLEDEDNVKKIRLAKKIIIEKMADPYTISELAKEIGLNEYRLKEGFKNIYGTTVFKFLNDYRLDVARQLLEQDHVKVNEAAYQIGYTNPSHFIAAFRKKFGVTPKKYLLNR